MAVSTAETVPRWVARRGSGGRWFPWHHRESHGHSAPRRFTTTEASGNALGMILTWMVVNTVMLQHVLHRRAFDQYPCIALPVSPSLYRHPCIALNMVLSRLAPSRCR